MKPQLSSFLSRKNILIFSVVCFVFSISHLSYLFYKENSIVAPKAGGTYKEGIIGTIKSPNPLFASTGSPDEDIVSLLYSGLTKFDPKQQKIVPDLATFQVSGNKKEYTFFLQPNVKWHDGVALTADDVVFTYETIQKKEFSNIFLKRKFADIKVQKVDESTVKFILPKPYLFFPTATTLGILPKHVWESVPVDTMAQSSLNYTPVGTGPFMADTAGLVHAQNSTNAQIVSLLKNPTFYGQKTYLEGVTLEVFPDAESLMAQKDALEAIADVPEKYWTTISGMDRFQKYTLVSPRYFAAFLNLDHEVLKNWRTRLALQVAISREDIMKDFPFLKTTNTPFGGQQDNAWTNEFNLDRAKGSLFDAGWKFPDEAKKSKKANTLISMAGSGSLLSLEDTSTGSLLRNLTLSGSRLEDIMNDYAKVRHNEKDEDLALHMVVAQNPGYLVEVAQGIKSQWELLGMNVTLDIKDMKDISTVIAARDYDVVLLGQELGYDQDIYPYWHSSQANKRGYNLSNFKNTTADSLIDEMRNPAKNLNDDEVEVYLSDHIAQLTKIFSEQIPAIFLFQPSTLHVVDRKYQNVYMQHLVLPSDRFETIAEWYQENIETLRISFTFGNFMSWIRQHF